MNGLSTQEVLERRAKGLGNRDPVRTSRSYFQIVRENVFTFVNLVLLGLGTALVLLGRPSDAIVSVLVILINVIVSVAQEIRAKRTLDRIALLTWPKATVLRDGQEQAVDPDEIVLGDILVLRPGDEVVVDGQVVEKQIASWADQGLRVLVFAANPEVVPLADEVGQPRLPEGLVPFGLVSLSEELRPEAQATLDAFAKAGVRLKIISGDSPRTFDAVARRVGYPSPAKLVSGLDLQQMSADEFAQAAREGDIFGRITPAQKERLVQALRDAGHYVAMVGDGVNDVLALKRANLAVAMAAWAQPGVIRREGLLRRLWHFVLPASLTLGLAGLAVFLVYSFFGSGVRLAIVRIGGSEADLSISQSAVTHFALLCGLFLIVFAEPPARFWVGGDVLSSFWT